jgi:hypothetical protein
MISSVPDVQTAQEGLHLCEQALAAFAHFNSLNELQRAITLKTRYLVAIIGDFQQAYGFLLQCAPYLQ